MQKWYRLFSDLTLWILYLSFKCLPKWHSHSKQQKRKCHCCITSIKVLAKYAKNLLELHSSSQPIALTCEKCLLAACKHPSAVPGEESNTVYTQWHKWNTIRAAEILVPLPQQALKWQRKDNDEVNDSGTEALHSQEKPRLKNVVLLLLLKIWTSVVNQK